MIPLASITEQLANFATKTVDHLGYGGVFVLMTLESACIPVPSEATMLFSGFNVADGRFSLLLVVLVGTLANLVGSWIAYGVGYYGRVELIERHGRKLHVSPAQLARADRWFARWGSWAVFFSRMLPIVRTFISLPAGVARMPFVRFSILTFLGCVPWVLALGFVGQQVGSNWESWRHYLEYFDYAVAALIALGVVYLVVKRVRSGGGGEPAADVAG